MQEMTPAQIVEVFILELVRIYGRERADLSRVYYEHGWFYIQLAHKTSSGSYGIWGEMPGYRKKEVLEMLAHLKTMEDK